jgi:1,4-dihydroxy-2-naphthoyl-CoA hydrolase
MPTLDELQAQLPPFAALLGMRLLAATPERITAELTIRDDLCTIPAIAHGGCLMAFADTLGAVATIVNLPAGAGTTTLESKTNFFAPAPAGTTITGECVALHRGRRTMVWQTRLTDARGRLLTQVTQRVCEKGMESAGLVGRRCCQGLANPTRPT